MDLKVFIAVSLATGLAIASTASATMPLVTSPKRPTVGISMTVPPSVTRTATTMTAETARLVVVATSVVLPC